jgi:hypothetical protein
MADDKAMAPEMHDRRSFITKSAVAATVVATTGTAEAQQAPGRLPLNAPIKSLGLNPAELAMLTPAAQKLTKSDLMELREYQAKGDTKNAPLHLSVQDLNSITAAFHAMDTRLHQPGALQGASSSISCCCCTPCCSCCAAADIA